MCGWGRWAAAAEDETGLTSLLVNPCGYGESVCTDEEDADPLNEVAAAVAMARDELGAERVVLLGTSMGGSLTVMAVAAGADVDAWADVSGPAAWDGARLAPLAPSLTPNGLVVMAPSDGQDAYDDAEALADAAGVPFVPGRNGHGWDLLVNPVNGSVTRIGRRLTVARDGPLTPTAIPIWCVRAESAKMFRLLRRVARARHTLTSESRLLDRNSRLRAPHRIRTLIGDPTRSDNRRVPSRAVPPPETGSYRE